jgi:mannose/cellobiose epimerase-like protein (N-acyl-D-glucosamine 2-epimerase family)
MSLLFWDTYARVRGRRMPERTVESGRAVLHYDAAFLRAHALECLLPFWERYAADAQHGGYFTYLRANGTVYDTRKVAAMQARMAYAFADAARETQNSRYYQLAAHATRFLRARMWDARHGGWIACCSGSGEPIVRDKQTFAQAYVIVGLAQCALPGGDSTLREVLEESYEAARRHLYDETRGGYYTSAAQDWELRCSTKTVCSQLDMLLAGLQMHRVTGDARYVHDAAELADLMIEHMRDEQHGCLVETCSASWRYLPGANRDVIWFGHNLKAAWELLHLYLLTGAAKYAQAARALIDFAIRFGYDHQNGAFFHYAFRNGRLASDEKLWWTNCEAIMALLLADSIGGTNRYVPYVNGTLDFSLRFFADSDYGEWFRSCGPTGDVRSSAKGGGDKAAYHTVQALLEATRYVRGPTSRSAILPSV